MAIKRENYTRMGIYVFVYVLFILSLRAQAPICPIWADKEPVADQTIATPTIYSQSVTIPFRDWEELENSRYSDDQYASVTLDGIKRAEIVTFSRWGHKIPQGSTIQGIELTIEGHQTGNGLIRDITVQLPNSENKAGDYLGVAFPDSVDQVWRYGGSDDLWGRNWSASDINSSSFGLEYQVRNQSVNETHVNIDQITIEVFYTPMYSFCNDGHACVAFGVEEVAGYQYNWDIPIGFARLSSLNEQYTVNIGPTTAGLGQYTLCINVNDENNNFVESCCRTFLYKDCRTATIGDQVFLDTNNDNIFSLGDEVLPGVSVFLYDDFNNLIDSTTTNNNGIYEFADVESDNYYIQIPQLEGLLPITPFAGNEDVDSDLTGSNGPYTTHTFFVDHGANINNIDLGLATELVVGNRVWEDKNGNGIQDVSEEGIAGVEVQLLSSQGDTLLTTLTDTLGIYGFDGIRVGSYEILFIADDHFLPTTNSVGLSDIDSDIDENGSTGTINFSILDMPISDIDAGFFRYASVGDYVFFDHNENGIQDSLDSPQDSVQVSLFDSNDIEIASILTDDSGVFLFDSLMPGEYYIQTNVSELIKPTFTNEGDDETLDSDLIDNEGDYATSTFMLMSNENNLDIDLGFLDNTSSLGGIVFEDIKYDGQYDVVDSLLSGIQVHLFLENGTEVQSTTTDSNGEYLFTGLLQNNYYITFELGNQYLFTHANAGDDSIDSDVTESVTTASTDVMIITPGMKVYDIFAGVYRYSSIGDYVFLDFNEDGIQNAGDSGIADFTLILLDENGTEYSTTATNQSGEYTFDNLVPGDYTIVFENTDLYLAAPEGLGTDTTDSDVITVNGEYQSIVISTCSGQQIDTVDLGFVHNYATLSGVIFEDSKADGIMNNLDTLIANILVYLYDTNGDLAQASITDSVGRYTFENVLTGEYYIVYNFNENYVNTTNDITEINGLNSTDKFTLLPGEIVDDLETGVYIPGSLGDYVFLDLNENGMQDAGDSPLQGITIQLTDADGNLVDTKVTTATGLYSFDNLVPGNYTIELLQDALYLPTESNVGNEDIDSDLLEINGQYSSGTVTVCSGQQFDNIDFGFVHNYASISGQVFEDSKADGLYNNTDTTIVNVQVSLYYENGDLAQTSTTNLEGEFVFENILAGDYYIVYGLPNSYVYTTSNVTSSIATGSTDIINVAPGESITNQLTGAYIPGSLGDYVFLDLDENGMQDAGDSPLQGITIQLTDADGNLVDTKVTTATGLYSFDNLVPGNYTIELLQDALYLPTESNVGNEDIDSDLLEINGQYSSGTVTVCSGQQFDNIDFGFIHNYASISGLVFEDSKADSLFNGTDTTLTNIPVTLFKADNTVYKTTTTDGDGKYTFSDVLEGSYYISYGLESDYIYTASHVTGLNGAGTTDIFMISSGVAQVDPITGAYRVGSIGDFVFLDINEDGIQDDQDFGIGNILIELFDLDGNLVTSTTSDSDGAYTLPTINPGQYVILVADSDLYLPTQANAGNNDNDSDLLSANGILTTEVITICSGQNDDTIDFGFVHNYAHIAGSVFEDSKANGYFDTPDIWIEATMVTLYNSNNEVVNSTMTDAEGQYIFNDILAGDYYIVYGLSSDYIYSTSDVTNSISAGSTDMFTLLPGQSLDNDPTGAYTLASVGDYVFLDVNENGIQNTNESGLEDVKLTLYNEQGISQGMQTSDTNGMYKFDNIVPGKYIIQVQFSDQYVPTAFHEGDENLDSDLQEFNGLYFSDTLLICSGQEIINIDFGLAHNYGQIGGLVFTDKMADGQYDSADILLPLIAVTLFDEDGVEQQTTNTDNNGAYLFDDVLAGNYYVTFEIGNQIPTIANVGDDNTDSDVTESNSIGSTDIFTLNAGESDLTKFAGVYELASLGDYIWLDENRNGLQDVSEQGIEGVVVKVYTAQGQVIEKDSTDVNGIYGFDNLMPGMYYIEVSYPEDLIATINNTSDATINSDIMDSNGLGISGLFPLMSGMNNLDIDGGLTLAGAEIQGEVWIDIDGDQMQSAGDTLLAEIPVTLFNDSGMEIFTTTTTEDGTYSFKPIDTGDYYVQFQIADTLVYVNPSVGAADVDSDVTDLVMGSTDVISVMIGDVVTDVDAGVEDGRSMISGHVFVDKNGNGINESTEINVEEYTVNLYLENGTLINSTTANLDGTYAFNNIPTGMYYVTFDVADSYVFTDPDVGDDMMDSDVITVDQMEGVTDVFTLGVQDSQVYDAGVFELGSIGDFVWFDDNEDGIQDLGESGIPFVNLTIKNMYGEDESTIVTETDGAYLFENLAPGRYWVLVEAPIGLKATIHQAGDSELDSDLLTQGTILLSDTIMIMSGQNYLSLDFGFVENPGSIQGIVWNDIDTDGVYNDAITAFDPVTVELYNDSSVLMDMTTTDANGAYIFNDVAPGEYYVKVVLNANTSFTIADQGNDDLDSDINGGNGAATTETFSLTSGQSIANIYAGLIFPGKIGDFVFLDENTNGIQDAGEMGIPSMSIFIYDENGSKLDSTITDIEGKYVFMDLAPGNYYLEFVYPDAIQPTILVPGMVDLDSDINEANGEGTTDLIFVGSGVCIENVDAGFIPTGAVIVGEVWLDTDGDNIQDNPNNPVSDVPVLLYTFSGTLVAQTESNELGIYTFSSVPAGTYYIDFDIPDSLEFVTANIGPEDTDSDVTEQMTSISTSPFVVVGGALYDNIDAGVRESVTVIIGQVFVDENGNGEMDSSESGLNGVPVSLIDFNTGLEIASVNSMLDNATMTNGYYAFTDVPEGDYYIVFDPMAPYLFTDANIGSDDTDSDVTEGTNGAGSTDNFSIQNGEIIANIDAGVFLPSQLGDLVWNDLNENGIQDAGEPGITDITIKLFLASGQEIASTNTDAEGIYDFDGLKPGDYYIEVSIPTDFQATTMDAGNDDTNDSDISDIGKSADVTLGYNTSYNLLDAGLVMVDAMNASITGLIWSDINGNGIRESNDTLFQGVLVTLYDLNDIEIDTDITLADGSYIFENLPAGSYYIIVDNPIGTLPTLPNVANEDIDSDITGANGGSAYSSSTIMLAASEMLQNVDGGFIAVGAIGDRVFIDINGNGKRGSNEPGLNDVLVSLYNADSDMLVATTTTETDIALMEEGHYVFNDVQAGNYYVTFQLPSPYLFTSADIGLDEKDSDVTEGANGPGSTDDFNIANGEVITHLDAGVFLPAQVGDFVWNDLNENGIQDAGEPGIANVNVVLKRSNNLTIATTTTDVSGIYCFDGLKQGLYFVEFEIPAGFVATSMNVGNDTAIDSDLDDTGTTPLVSVSHGSNFKLVDAGFFSQSNNNLVSHVWLDENENGIIDNNEKSIRDIVISLLDDQNNVIAEAITNYAGKYAFTNIDNGDYQISVGLEDGLAPTMMNAGNDDMIDSDVDEQGMSSMFSVNDGLSIPNVDIGLVESQVNTPIVTEEIDQIAIEEDDSETEISEDESPVEISIGPNPFYDKVQVGLSKVVDGIEYTIVGLDGAVVKSGKLDQISQWIEIDTQTDGLYVFILTQNGVQIEKQVLMKFK